MEKKFKQWTLDLFLEETQQPKKKDLHFVVPLTEEEVEFLKSSSEKAFREFKSEMKILIVDILDKAFKS